MSSPYKRVLLVGATSGIGAALADKFILEGSKVIAVGRRQERLDTFVKKHGEEQASGVRYDVNDTAGLGAFVDGIINQYPDLDCVFLNSGTQSQVRLSKPAEVDLDAFHQEMTTNFTRLVDLSINFLSHLQNKSYPTALIITGSLLAHVPAVTMPAYSASKAALTAYVDCLRRQNAGSSTKIIEVWPPVVQTELHDYMGPDRGRSLGMPVAEFVEKVWPQLATGLEHIIVDAIGSKETFLGSVNSRRELFAILSEILLAHF
ncbi:hypothetical protein B0J13DRAFT_40726 [Dactylonectria estremocensis]|uniref:Uncharacterized protein n=1 Tax=Dactylonectria estremocensis TaxID=1079267 RepID=A0A9P9ET99_9HYPO|nr:hypothetical protein B0J13DRAFT_40726 [Dactylonectria estremocensis]